MDAKFMDILNGINTDIIENKEVNLLDEGIIDSLQIMMLVSSLEDAYSINIDPDEIIPENFESVNAIWNLVEKSM